MPTTVDNNRRAAEERMRDLGQELRRRRAELAGLERELRAAEAAAMVSLIESDLADSAPGLGSIITRRPDGWAAV
jgi:hypothetical protein